MRHAEVENPANIWYGLLDGYPLSAAGRARAAKLGEFFAGHRLAAVYASRLERAQETAAAIASPHEIDVQTSPEIIEAYTHLEGRPVQSRVMLVVTNVRYFVNPFHPTWGEPYREVAARMVRGITAVRLAHPGEESVVVSHMTPIQVGRLAIEGRRLRPWLAKVPCARGSVTTLVFEDDRWVRTEYQEVGGPGS